MSNLTKDTIEDLEADAVGGEFQDLHVVVTGGTGALGSAVVALLLDRGAWCHVPYMKEIGGLSELKHSRLNLIPEIDLRVEASAGPFFAALPQLWASIHLAGGFKPGSILETALADMQEMFLLNAGTSLICCREAVRRMQGQGSAGRIVNVAAQAAIVPTAGSVAYSASKAAVVSLTRSIAEEVKEGGILVNAIAPSIMDTPANRRSMPNADYSRWPSTNEVAETILYLASPRNTLTSGATIPVYGRM